MSLKCCTKCGEMKLGTTEYFPKDARLKCGLRASCRKCESLAAQEYHAKNGELRNARCREYYHKNIEKQRERRSTYRLNNIDIERLQDREYAKNNRDKINARNRHYRRSNHTFRIARSVGSSIHASIKQGGNGRHWETLVGYTLYDLMRHLESQFTKGMTWENYGRYGWHIDHIRPLADFNFISTDDSDFRVCWSLWNLQPLWAKDNHKKSNKVEAPPLPLITQEVADD